MERGERIVVVKYEKRGRRTGINARRWVALHDSNGWGNFIHFWCGKRILLENGKERRRKKWERESWMSIKRNQSKSNLTESHVPAALLFHSLSSTSSWTIPSHRCLVGKQKIKKGIQVFCGISFPPFLANMCLHTMGCLLFEKKGLSPISRLEKSCRAARRST